LWCEALFSLGPHNSSGSCLSSYNVQEVEVTSHRKWPWLLPCHCLCQCRNTFHFETSIQCLDRAWQQSEANGFTYESFLFYRKTKICPSGRLASAGSPEKGLHCGYAKNSVSFWTQCYISCSCLLLPTAADWYSCLESRPGTTRPALACSMCICVWACVCACRLYMSQWKEQKKTSHMWDFISFTCKLSMPDSKFGSPSSTPFAVEPVIRK
jgi:hypothetical protein